MEREYNLLTQRLLEEGYSEDNYPDYVRLPGSCWGKNLLQNLDDGFVYTNQYRDQMVFKTGCGLLVKGSYFCNGHMSYMGRKWTIENDCPTITCPYRKDSCNLRDPVLGEVSGGVLSKILHCDCHRTNESYSYERSFNKVRDDEQKEIKRKYDEFVKKKKGHVCHWHANYNYQTGEWQQDYDPMTCARHCMNIGRNCELTGKPVSKKKGNVFYDVKVSYIQKERSLFYGQEVIRINKGVRLFDTAKSMTICEQAANRCRKYIEDREYQNRHAEVLLYGWKVEVLNIRAEQREGRDLMQDLQDIKDGIIITHASDAEKKQKEDKKKRRQQAQENRIKKLEKKLLTVGYYNLDEYSLDRVHADKWIGAARISELERQRKELEIEKNNNPVQMSIFDFMEG